MTTKMLRVYAAGPIQGKSLLESLTNIRNGLTATKRLLDLGFAPLPIYSDFMMLMADGAMPSIDHIYKYSLAWLEVSDAVLMLKGWDNSVGAKKEMQVARELEIPIFYSVDELVDWKNYDRGMLEIMRKGDD